MSASNDPPRFAASLGLLGLVATSAALAVVLRPAGSDSVDPVAVPAGAADGYATSAACRSCHPAEHHTWHDSYHRSMTQRASTDSVLAPWQDIRLEQRGARFELFRRGDDYWARLPDPDRMAAGAAPEGDWSMLPRVERQIVMTTGSHHYQGFWTLGARGNELWQLPFVYHLESQRFIPRHDAFLQPPDDPPHLARWNSSCIQCHSVAGRPGHDQRSDRFASRAAELGIACEACHGPGEEHVARHRNPLGRYRARRDDQLDDSIVNPARLDARASSEVCGQCHSFFVPRDPDEWWEQGFATSYRPGRDLSRSREVLHYERDRDRQLLSDDLDSIFYQDGTVRVGGRELNGLTRSACFERGEGRRQLGCLSCHRLHGGTRDDQLDPDRPTDAACASCHEHIAAAAAEHGHHAPGSSGSSCINCHMPHTSYALLQAIRSHRITIPSARRSRDQKVPNACNLCHLDRGLGWTAALLTSWYGQPGLEAPTPERAGEAPQAAVDRARHEWSAAGTDLLAGDAVLRVVAAHQMGWAEAAPLADASLRAQLLARALDDPYAAVRFVTGRSLTRQAGFEDFDADFLAPASERRRRSVEAGARARRASASPVDPALLEALTRARDPRPVRIAE